MENFATSRDNIAPTSNPTPRLQEQSVLDQFGTLSHPADMEVDHQGGRNVQETVPSVIEHSPAVSSSDPQLPGKQLSGMFTAVTVNANMASNYETSSYKEVMTKLNSLWPDQMREIENYNESHWKNLEFPLARIKKIMRMDDEVKMISTEVPVMFSKILEIFITELTMRSWLHTEESKRRTVQRSDIAMAITKHDMFDFLIDIVPREEIQLKTKTQKDAGEGVQVLPPEILQLYIQQVINQTLTSMAASGEDGDDSDGESAVTANALQQLQLLQQLVQLQQTQQEQQQQQDQQQQQQQQQQFQDPNQLPQSGAENGRRYEATGVDIQVLHSSSGPETISMENSTVGTTQHQHHLIPSSTEPPTNIIYGQQTLHHVDSPQNFQPQQQQQQQALFESGQQSHITTVVIPQPLDSLVHQQATPQPQNCTVSMLDTPAFQLQLHQGHNLSQDESLQNQLDSLETEQFISQGVPVELASSEFATNNGGGGGGGEGERDGEGRVEFQNVPENQTLPSTISPITGLPPTTEQLSNVFTSETHKY